MTDTPKRKSRWDRLEELPPSFFEEVSKLWAENWLVILSVPIGFLLFLGLLTLLTREYKGDITGKVTLDGKPIPWGRVTFVSQTGNRKSVSGRIKNGVYEVKGCPRGLAKISVESFPATKAETKLPTKELLKGFAPPKNPDEPPPDVIGQYMPLPPRYGAAHNSRLQFNVGFGSNTYDILMTKD
jgi:hypothetical protein